MKYTHFFILLTLIFGSTITFSQSEFKPSANADPSIANENFQNLNYIDALRDYLALVKKEPKNPEYNYRTGVCYLNTDINKAKAIPYLEIAARSEKPDADIQFQLGRAYHLTYKFDDAIKAFTKFKQSGKGSSEFKKVVDRYMEYSYNAKELVKFPLNVTFTNLGKNINSPYPDYYPFVPSDEDYIVYNTRRKEGGMKTIDGNYTSSVFMSKLVNGEFGKGKSIGPPINTGDGDEEVVGLSNSGDIMILVYDNMVDFANLYISYADKKMNFKKAEVLPKQINSGAQEIAGSVTEDGRTIYFTSTRSGGKGGSDLYVCRKLPDNTWSPAQNLGDVINTEADEDFPNISPDGKTLYFSSNGSNSMGGHDIFKATWDESDNKWTNIKNFGYPVNTTDDDMNLRLSTNGRHGYIAALRDGGIGDLDIYRLDFNNVEANLSLVTGKIISADTVQKISYPDVFITVTDVKTKEVFGNYTPNPHSGKYVMILPAGEYNVGIELPNFQTQEDKIVVTEKIAMRQELVRDVIMYPNGFVKPEPQKKTAPVKGQTTNLKKTK